MNRSQRRPIRFRPQAEACEPRQLLSAGGASIRAARSGVLRLAGGGEHPVRPNTPVLPYGSPSRFATFLDPSSRILQGDRIALRPRTYVGPFAGLDATAGYIKVGEASAILDNAVLVANPGRSPGLPGIEVGDQAVIQYGARVEGGSRIGGFGAEARPTSIGPNAVIRGATIEPGALVDAGAVVAGVTIASGLRVLPGAVVATQAEASDPALGKVAPATAADLAPVRTLLSDSSALAAGYTTLYQGQSDTGAAGFPEAATTTPGLFNGNLARVRGTSAEPGTPFEPRRLRPRFLTLKGKTIAAGFADFPARIVGGVTFQQRPGQVANRVGKNVAIRGDEGQPIAIGSIARLGDGATLHAERGGSLAVGRDLRVGDGAVIVGGPGSTIGDDVAVGSRAVVRRSRLGSGVVVGDGAIVLDSTIAPGEVVPAGAVIIGGVAR